MTDLRMQTGEVFDGKYEILEFLGAGGIGCVYKAKQLDTFRILALKILAPAAGLDEEDKARFLQEGKILSRLEHENIVKVFHLSISSNGLLYLAMEFIAGKSLRAYLQEVERILPEQAVAFVLELAVALDHVHEHNLVHRDLKPENIILEETKSGFKLKIVDFGLARLLPGEDLEQKLTHTGQLIGTCAYMSPEQCMGKAVDCRSDVYSLGLCFYELLEGKRLFDADTAVGLMYKHLNEKVPELSFVRNGRFGRNLNRVLQKCLHKDPGCRYQSMQELCRELSAIQMPDLNKAESRPASKPLLLSVLILVLILGGVLFCLFVKKPGLANRKAALTKTDAPTLSAEFEKLSPRMRLSFLRNELAAQKRSQVAALALSVLERNGAIGLNEKIELLGLHILACDAIAHLYSCAAVLDLDRKYPGRVPEDLVQRALYGLALTASDLGLNKTTLSLLKRIEQKQSKSNNSPVLSGSSRYFDPKFVALTGVLEAKTHLNLNDYKSAKTKVIELLSRDLPFFVLLDLLEICLKLDLKKELEAKLGAFSSLSELCLSSNKYLSLGRIQDAARILKKAEDHARQGPVSEKAENSEFILALARARLSLESKQGKSEEAKSILRRFAESALERVAPLSRKHTIGILTSALMIAEDDQLAWKLKGAESDCSYKHGRDLIRVARDLKDSNLLALKEARSLLYCPELPDLDRIVLSHLYRLCDDPEFPFLVAAAANAVERNPDLTLNTGLACLETYGEYLRSEKLIGKEMQVMRLIEHINHRYNKTAERVALGFAAKARCRRIETSCKLGKTGKARQLFAEMNWASVSPYFRISCLLSLGDAEAARKAIKECGDTEDLIMVSEIALSKGQSDLAALAIENVNPEQARMLNRKACSYKRLCFSKAQLALERSAKQAAADCLLDPSFSDLSSLSSSETLSVLNRLILLTAVAELPDETLKYLKQYRSLSGVNAN